jgi:7-cyano-7-deazaguanine tRNA-ribosyltransferase
LEIVAGLCLSSIKPRVWDAESSYHLPDLTAVMISYADLYKMPKKRKLIMEQGIHSYFGIPEHVKVYLDNGAFYFLVHEGAIPVAEYTEFITEAQPNWYPIPQDFIPSPSMSLEEQRQCLNKTMAVNTYYREDDYVPVVHISRVLAEYLTQVREDKTLSAKADFAIGGIVPNLLKTARAMHQTELIEKLKHIKQEMSGKKLHVFGIGGTTTVHLAALLGFDSFDSCGWRNRAARGIIQLPGRGERVVAELGSWRGRIPDETELKMIDDCQCPVCHEGKGRELLAKSASEGFCNRAAHNLWVLLEEARWVEAQLAAGTYAQNYKNRLDNSLYLPLIEKLVGLDQPTEN